MIVAAELFFGQALQYNVRGVHIEQLFDLTVDPYETQNLAGNPDHSDRRDALEAALIRVSEVYNDPLDLAQQSWGKQ